MTDEKKFSFTRDELIDVLGYSSRLFVGLLETNDITEGKIDTTIPAEIAYASMEEAQARRDELVRSVKRVDEWFHKINRRYELGEIGAREYFGLKNTHGKKLSSSLKDIHAELKRIRIYMDAKRDAGNQGNVIEIIRGLLRVIDDLEANLEMLSFDRSDEQSMAIDAGWSIINYYDGDTK